jgi:hypothetical protein
MWILKCQKDIRFKFGAGELIESRAVPKWFWSRILIILKKIYNCLFIRYWQHVFYLLPLTYRINRIFHKFSRISLFANSWARVWTTRQNPVGHWSLPSRLGQSPHHPTCRRRTTTSLHSIPLPTSTASPRTASSQSHGHGHVHLTKPRMIYTDDVLTNHHHHHHHHHQVTGD